MAHSATLLLPGARQWKDEFFSAAWVREMLSITRPSKIVSPLSQRSPLSGHDWKDLSCLVTSYRVTARNGPETLGSLLAEAAPSGIGNSVMTHMSYLTGRCSCKVDYHETKISRYTLLELLSLLSIYITLIGGCLLANNITSQLWRSPYKFF